MNRRNLAVLAAALAAALLLFPSVAQSTTGKGFVATVIATHPIAYFRLQTMRGKSEVGSASFVSKGGVTSAAPGAPIGVPSRYANFNGSDGFFNTTLMGRINGATSILVWVNLKALPSTAGLIFYVAGESEYGNDIDLQFEPDNNTLRFYTSNAPHVSFVPPADTLLNQWHMIVATLDTKTGLRAIYWDGKVGASDHGGGIAKKKNEFTIGASKIFPGRWFRGGIQDVAVWNRALSEAEIATIYASAQSTLH